MNDTVSILSIQSADFGYLTGAGKKVLLSGINLNVRTPSLIGLIGRNGSGKSTILKTIVRLHDLLEGNIFLNGRNIKDYHRYELAQYISYVSTAGVENETMTIRELVSLGRFPYTNWIGSLKVDDKEIVEESMQIAGISFLADRKISEVSDGEKQRAMIARTLAQKTPVIILDEPTAYLDLPSKYDLVNLLYDMTREGITVIYSTHDLNISLKFSDRILIIDKNNVFEGTPEDMVLDNTIARIFESDKISFKPESGDFELRRSGGTGIRLAGNESTSLIWTKQALIRKGYSITDDPGGNISIEIRKEITGIIWILQRENQILYYQSIDGLLSGLKNI